MGRAAKPPPSSPCPSLSPHLHAPSSPPTHPYTPPAAPGVVVAVRGQTEPGGDFVVTDVLFPEPPSQPPLPPLGEDVYVALVSGLALGCPETDMLRVSTSREGVCEGFLSVRGAGVATALAVLGVVLVRFEEEAGVAGELAEQCAAV